VEENRDFILFYSQHIFLLLKETVSHLINWRYIGDTSSDSGSTQYESTFILNAFTTKYHIWLSTFTSHLLYEKSCTWYL